MTNANLMSSSFQITEEFLEDAPQDYMDAFLDLLSQVEVVKKENIEGKDTIEIKVEDEGLPDVDRLKLCFHSEGSGVNALFRVADEDDEDGVE